VAGDNGWQDNHAALNEGLNNHWATNNTPWSWGHFQRGDIPVQFAIAEAWTIGDMYQVRSEPVVLRELPRALFNPLA
jgi:phospholipase C